MLSVPSSMWTRAIKLSRTVKISIFLACVHHLSFSTAYPPAGERGECGNREKSDPVLTHQNFWDSLGERGSRGLSRLPLFFIDPIPTLSDFVNLSSSRYHFRILTHLPSPTPLIPFALSYHLSLSIAFFTPASS